jgi:hypothetical protein
MPRAKRARIAGVLSVSAAPPEKPKRVSSRPKMASIEKFIRLLDTHDDEKKLMRAAADLWYEFKLVIDAAETPRAISYGERVNQSLTHMTVQMHMARQSDKLASAREYRSRTAPRARDRLDLMVLQGASIEDCAMAEWGRSDQSAIKNIRRMIVENLLGFAALTRLPGAN